MSKKRTFRLLAFADFQFLTRRYIYIYMIPNLHLLMKLPSLCDPHFLKPITRIFEFGFPMDDSIYISSVCVSINLWAKTTTVLLMMRWDREISTIKPLDHKKLLQDENNPNLSTCTKYIYDNFDKIQWVSFDCFPMLNCAAYLGKLDLMVFTLTKQQVPRHDLLKRFPPFRYVPDFSP